MIVDSGTSADYADKVAWGVWLYAGDSTARHGLAGEGNRAGRDRRPGCGGLQCAVRSTVAKPGRESGVSRRRGPWDEAGKLTSIGPEVDDERYLAVLPKHNPLPENLQLGYQEVIDHHIPQ